MCPNETAAAVTALAALLVEKIPPEEAALLAAVFTQLGDTMVTIMAGNELCSDRRKGENER